jgi:hypothetical protein
MKNYLIVALLSAAALICTQTTQAKVFITKDPRTPTQELPVITEESDPLAQHDATHTTINITLSPQLTLDTPNAVATVQTADDQAPKKSSYLSLMYFVILVRAIIPSLPFPY